MGERTWGKQVWCWSLGSHAAASMPFLSMCCSHCSAAATCPRLACALMIALYPMLLHWVLDASSFVKTASAPHQKKSDRRVLE
eukprot:559549-Amphidinium_carterae.1